jgi:hypothetical protein
MLRAMIVMGALAAGPAWAEDWTAVSGAEIAAVLEETTLVYEDAKQVFYKLGRTLYDSGRPSWGYWAVRGDQYCSQWPPADGWACYGLERHRDADRVRFVSETGHVSEGAILE